MKAAVFVLTIIVLAACAALPRAAPTPTPTQTPWRLGTPEPLLAPLTSACPAAEAAQAPRRSMAYGMNVFLFATDMERVLTLSTTTGAEWIRQQIHWRDLEGEQGKYVWRPLDQVVSAARAHDLNILLSVVRSPAWATSDGNTGLPDDLTPFAAFMREVATRYRGRVSAYEIWNEPNLSHECGGTPCRPAAYLATLQAAYRAIKDVDPCALVLAAPMAATNNADPQVARDDLPFYEELYRLDGGAFLHAADAVAVHPGGGPHPPDDHWPPDTPDLSHTYFRHIERVHDLMLRHGDQRPVWITEVGWTVTSVEGAPQPVSEQQQADYLVDMLWQVRQRYPWVAGVLVWNLNFSVIAAPDDEKTTFSILAPDWSIRPAFLSLQNTFPALRDIDRPPFFSDGADYTFAWNFPGRGAMHTHPLFAPDGTIYAVSDPGTTYAISPTGTLNWLHNASGMVSSAPALAPDGMLFLADSAGLLTRLRPDGSKAWETRLRSPVRGSPLYHEGYLYTVNMVGDVQAFDMAGNEVWSRALDAETTPLAIASDATLLLAQADGSVIKMNRRDGMTLWAAPTGGQVWAELAPDQRGGVVVVTVDGQVVALDAQGQIRWQHRVGSPVVAQPLVAGNTVFVADRGGTLTALAADTGVEQWQFSSGSDLRAPPAVGSNGTIFVGTEDGRLMVLDEHGTLRWQAYLRGAVRAPPVVGRDGTLFVATTAGRLYAFRPAQ